MPMPALRWFVKCALTAALLLLACGLATAWLGNGLQLPATTTRDGTLTTLNRYVREPTPDVVLVGSSLTFRLKEEYFSTPGVKNLALAGGSPVTGFEIVANQAHLPKLILVEMNILSRATDKALVEKYSAGGNTDPLFFRPVRTAVAAYENWNHAPPDHAQVALALDRLLKQPPSNFDNHVYVERAFQEMDAEDPTVAVGINVMRIQHLISAVEQRGARVQFFELPYSDRLEKARSVGITYEIVHNAFPDPNRWLKLDYPRSELRWSDGVHLDERSALIVAQLIDRALVSLPGSM
ncbi:MAG TPA: hypothetical protein VHB49_10010 [Bradyrhizobium sp.]|nr:hypothetical protein [Bradyrhizobium sp.]